MSIFAISDPTPNDSAVVATWSTVMYDIEHSSGSIASFTLWPSG